MKFTIFSAVCLVAVTGIAQAEDLEPMQIAKLQQSGIIKSSSELERTAMMQHPNSKVHDYEFEKENNHYVYEVELVDKQGHEWDLELDASTGKILKNELDS